MSSRTALVADDVEFTRRTIGKILAKAHYKVVAEAKNGKEALDFYSKLKPIGKFIQVLDESGNIGRKSDNLKNIFPNDI